MTALRLLACLLAVVLPAGGCGGGAGGAAGKDPASVLPAGSPLVVELGIGPDSEQGKAALHFAERIDPQQRDLADMLIKSFDANVDGYTYEDDVKPWLGEKVTGAVDGFDEFEGVFAFQVRDEDAARDFLAKASKGDKLVDASYKGIDYERDATSGSAQGFVAGLLVAASDEARFKRAVDASKGTSLAEDARYRQAVRGEPEERLALVYADVDPLLKELADSHVVPAETVALTRRVPGFKAGQTVAGSVVADADALRVEAIGDATALRAARAAAGPAPAVADLPAGTWIALGGPANGQQTLLGLRQGLRQSGTPGAFATAARLGLPEILGSLKRVSLHFGGTEISRLEGALTFGGVDPEAARAVVRRSAAEVRRLAGSAVRLRVSGSTATLTAGTYTVRLAADGTDLRLQLGQPAEGRLGDQPAFKDAVKALDLNGATPNAVVDFAGLGKLLRDPALGDDPDLIKARKAVDALGVLVFGSAIEGDRARARLVLTLR